jgi:prepilin-type N-terminal cleavage/methylation domain-containing protein
MKYCNDSQKTRQGLTLVEVLISVVILSFLVVAILTVLRVGEMNWREETALVSLQQDIRQSIDSMLKEIRQSNATDVTVSGGGTRIDFFIPDVSNAIAYYLTGDQIIREHPVGTTKVLANDINALTFTETGDTVIVQISATRLVSGRNVNFSLTEKVRLRNE